MGSVVGWELLGVLSSGAWRTLGVLGQTVGWGVWVGVLCLRRRSLVLLVLLMYDARGSRLLEMMRRWRALLRVVGVMVIVGHSHARLLFVSATLSMSHLGSWELSLFRELFKVPECRRFYHNSDSTALKRGAADGI